MPKALEFVPPQLNLQQLKAQAPLVPLWIFPAMAASLVILSVVLALLGYTGWAGFVAIWVLYMFIEMKAQYDLNQDRSANYVARHIVPDEMLETRRALLRELNSLPVADLQRIADETTSPELREHIGEILEAIARRKSAMKVILRYKRAFHAISSPLTTQEDLESAVEDIYDEWNFFMPAIKEMVEEVKVFHAKLTAGQGATPAAA